MRAAPKMKRTALGVALLAVLAACGGGGSPSAPRTAAPSSVSGWPVGTTVQLVSGDTAAPVAGDLIIAGAHVQAGVPLATAAPPGVTVDVPLAGFLSRQTMVRAGETRLTLWPDTTTFPGSYTQALVYTDTDGTTAPLQRLPNRVHTVAVTVGAGVDEATVRSGIDNLNVGSVPAGVRYQLGGTGDLTVPTRFDPRADTCAGDADVLAFARVWTSSASEITQAEVTFCRSDAVYQVGVAAHELGHTFGLNHSPVAHDLMAAYATRSGSEVPTPNECLAMRLMEQRRPGTAWPDNDRDAKAAALRRLTIID